MTDITYSNEGLFTCFYAESRDGDALMSQIVAQNEGSNKILSIHAKSVIAQIRKAGYKVKKAKKVTMSDSDLLDALLA